MADARLRDLERRFRASGSVEDEATWLRARVQAGELEQSRLELAAYCDHPAAVAALACQSGPRRLDDWVHGLERWGRETCVRAASAAAVHALAKATPRPSDFVRSTTEALGVAATDHNLRSGLA